jgi:hypothetical protein
MTLEHLCGYLGILNSNSKVCLHNEGDGHLPPRKNLKSDADFGADKFVAE